MRKEVPAMDDLRLDRLHPGLAVCDVMGDEIGTLAHIHRQERPAEIPEGERETSSPPLATDKIVEVKTGWFGLGKHLYVPAHTIETVTDDQVVLNRSREEVDSEGWSARPPNLTTLA
jgi:hypothetical protein